MAAIAPFRALRYRNARLAAVTSPPHDVLRPDQREELLARHAHNIVRLILPDGYDGAARLLSSWQDEGVLERDAGPALYWYALTHGPPTRRATMHGLFCRLRLDPTGEEVRPHERTHARRAGDRRQLLEATQCNTEPIWLLYRDERGWVDEIMSSNAMAEVARFTDEDGSEHRLFRVDRPEAVGEVVAQFDDRQLVIADGHHRYQTALDLFAATNQPEHASILVCLVRDSDPGVRIEPTHRLLDVPLEDALAAAATHWEATPLASTDAAAVRAAVGEDDRACALVGAGQAWLLRLREGHEVDRGRGTLDGLAVTRVHELLLAPLGVVGDAESRLRYTHSHEDAVAAAAAGSLAVILPPEPVRAVLDVAREGELMPQKATYFVPKLRSGLVLGPLDEPPPVPWSEQAGGPGPMEFRRPPL